MAVEQPSDNRRKVVIRDVAQAAGVSPSTVSCAFARPDRVSAATTKRIFRVADELGYHSEMVEPVPLRGLKHAIAVIVPDVADQFFSELIHSVQRVCSPREVTVILAESRDSAALERQTFDFMAPQVDGVILASSRMPNAMIRKCAQTRPVVVTNHAVRGVSSVVVDIDRGVNQLAEHMVQQGFHQVTYIDGPAASWTVGAQWNAFEQACVRHGVSVRRLWPGVASFEGGAACAQCYIENPTGAIVAYNDVMALGFIAAMRRAGYECPRDFCIAGFGNNLLSQISQPSLTSVHLSVGLVGSKAAEIVLARIHHETVADSSMLVPSKLIVRESTAASPQS